MVVTARSLLKANGSSRKFMVAEIWKDVVGWEGLYQVSDMGNVRSLDRVLHLSNGQNRKYKGKLLSLQTDRCYYKLVLVSPGRRRQTFAHTLVAESFIGPRPTNMEVCHGDGDGKNNSLDNLRYASRTENMKDTRVYGHPQSISIVRSDGKKYPSIGSVDDDGFDSRKVGQVCLGRRLTSGGYGWSWL